MKCSPFQRPIALSIVAAALATVFAPTGATAQDTLWTRTFGGTEDDYAFDASQTSDGGFILAGETYTNPSSGPSDVWLVKTDSDGGVEWERTFGGDLFDTGYSVQQTFDGGYIIAGNMQTPNASLAVFVVRTDAAGEELWSKTFGNQFTIDSGQSVIQTADSGFAITGWIRTPTAHDDISLIRLDTAGTTLWTKLIGGVGQDRGYSVKETADGGFVVVGTMEFVGATPSGDFSIVKTDSAGDVAWQKNYGFQSVDVARSVAQTDDGGYVVAGWIQRTDYDGWLLKTDANGDTLWAKPYGVNSDDEIMSVVQASDGGYAFAGTSGDDVWVAKTDGDGELEWERTFGGDDQDAGHSIRQTSDGGYVVGAHTWSFGMGFVDAWLLRIGAVNTSIETETPDAASGMELYANYPNPHSTDTRIEYAFERPTNAELTIFDIQGRTIRTLVDGFQDSGRRTVAWDGTTSSGRLVPSGAYFYRLKSERGVLSRMMMVVR